MYEKFLDFTKNFYESERRRLLNFVPVGMGVGICWYFVLDNEPSFELNLTIFLIILGICILLRKNILLIFLTISFGFLLAQIRTNHVNTFMLSEKQEKPISFVATVESCEKAENGLKFIVSEAKRKYDDEANELCKKFNKLSLTWRGPKANDNAIEYTPGSRVLFRIILCPIYPRSFPGAYDFRKQQYFKGISARGFIIKPPKIMEKANLSSCKIFIEQVRQKINREIERHLEKNTAAVVEALTTGNTAGVSKEIRAHFVNSGIAHLLAISGLHMGIIGFFIFWLFRVILCCFSRISMYHNVKKISAVISWAITLFYLCISGCSVPSCRAFIMHTLIIIAVLVNRTPLTMRSVAIAATVIMICTPEVVLFPSFQMSFGAVIAIVAFYECDWEMPSFLKSATLVLVTTVVASIPTSIFSIFMFNQLTLNSIVANVISIPLMSFLLMPLVAISLFAMVFGIAEPFVVLLGLGVDLLIAIADQISRLPGSFFVMPMPSNAVMAVLVASMLFLALIHHKIRLLGIAGFVCGIGGYFHQSLPDVFVSVDGKSIGIRTKDAVCFNNLTYFRSIGESWAKSVGFEKRERYDSENCKKCVSRWDNDTYVARVADKNIIITHDKNYQKTPDDFVVLRINDRKNKFAKLIYLPSKKVISSESVVRPWTISPE
ncbi:MAG: ComEC family competence protein [Holosporaceae bacterium]|jgi:competence protein ComEC|nr:ComEC family competence protein [Holosporaceae bacterium]